ncbi:SCAVenger receptor (CD36 family) related [Caenorhabditis elegans]|uniref:SCAVenger receptor (CD36 family) related n=1 Tax=Caenorhabditis elegans TaxID=6239 RepID=G5EBM7_CAEEL|nr:SCAVenger receptor (CD36 family) related [Caenorhabditis elegans]CAA21747.3 SCAVenger receptor (CD36 family) related [Caenorhabditis elegans]|eukprot:NP_499802.3 SCAVenger receptor (CD36 family) related [Caenorhabditis elegans]
MPSSNNSSNGASSSSPIASKYSSGRMRRMSCCQLVISAVLIGLGSFLLFGSLITHTVVVPKVVKSSIEENSRLVNGSIMWEKWAMPEYKIRFNMYVYSTKNPDEFMNGAIPEVTGSGPYVFDKKMENRVVSAENGTVKYRRFFTYNFNEQESCQTCILGNRIWVPNMIYQKFVEAASTEGMKAAATTLLSQTAFLEVEVEELLFEGYKDPFLDKVCEIPFMNFVCEAILDVPERIGLFFKANGTGSKVYEIDDGTRNPDDLGKILSYDESPILDETWWSTDESLKIKGTDGSLFHPFLSKHEKLYVYVAELCRSIWLEFKEEVEYRGLKAYRFVVPPEVFDVTHPGNQGFCNPSEKQFYESQNDSSNCMPKGLLEISKCQQSQPPITISLPNFLFAPSEVRGSVKGLNETDEIRDSIVVDIEPRVGAVLYARRVSQVNIEMWKGKNLTFPVNLKKMKSALIPVLILHETSEIDDDSLEQIRSQLYETESIAYTSCDVMMIIGAIMLLLGFLFLSFSLGLCDPILGRRSKRANGLSPEPLPPYVPKGEPNGYHHNHAYM